MLAALLAGSVGAGAQGLFWAATYTGPPYTYYNGADYDTNWFNPGNWTNTITGASFVPASSTPVQIAAPAPLISEPGAVALTIGDALEQFDYSSLEPQLTIGGGGSLAVSNISLQYLPVIVQAGGSVVSYQDTLVGATVHGAWTDQIASLGGNTVVDGSWTNGMQMTIAGTLAISNGGTMTAGQFINGSDSAVVSLLVSGSGSSLNIANTLQGTGSMTVQQGGWVSNLACVLADTPTFLVTDTNSSWQTSTFLNIGNTNQAGHPVLVVSNGASVSSGLCVLQANTVALLTGAGSIFSNAATLEVGFNVGLPTLTVSNGAQLIDTAGYIDNKWQLPLYPVTVTGSGSAWTNYGDLHVGGDSTGDTNDFSTGYGGLCITNGGSVSDSNGYIVGYSAYPYASAVLVTDTNSTWFNASNLYVGYAAQGTLTITNGGKVLDSSASITPSSTVIVTGPGSIWYNTGDENTNGDFLGGGDLDIGATNVYSGGPGGGSLTIQNQAVVVDEFATVDMGSSVYVDGTNSLWDNDGTLTIGIFGTGTVTVRNGGQLKVNDVLTIAANAGSTGTLKIGEGASGGMFTTKDTVQFGAGTGAVAFNCTNNNYIFAAPMSGPGVVIQNGTNTVILTGSNTYSGGTLIEFGVLQMGNGGNSGSLGTGPVTDEGALVFARSDSDLIVANVIGGLGVVTQLLGKVTFTGVNNYYGATTIMPSSTLAINSESALGPGTLTFDFNPRQLTLNGGTLEATATFSIANLSRGITLGPAGGAFFVDAGQSLAVTTVVTGPGNLTSSGPGVLGLSGANTYTGQTLINAGTLSIEGESALGTLPAGFTPGQLTIDGGTLATTETFSIGPDTLGVTLGAAGGTFYVDEFFNLTVANVIAGPGNLTISGPGTLTLTGANTYTGQTILNDGTLAFAKESALGVAPAGFAPGQLTFNGGALNATATFSLGPDTRGITLNANGGTFDLAPIAALTVGNPIAGVGKLTVSGGLLILTSINTYSGGTTVNSGQLLVDNPSGGSGAGSGPVTMAAGTVLGGNGFIGGAVTLQGDAALEPGEPFGTLTVNNNLTLSDTAELDFNIGAGSNNVVVNGNLSLGGIVNISSTGHFGAGFYTLFTYSGALTLGKLALGTVPNGYLYGLDTTSIPGQVRLVVTSKHANPTIANVSLKGTNLVLSGSGGNANSNYFVLTTTNLALPAPDWAVLSTNQFDGNGNFSSTNSTDLTLPGSFFQLKLQ
jgi:T5SS/PEP-CTERM-associated repeat protein/autotransporter-associated beta strand protein